MITTPPIASKASKKSVINEEKTNLAQELPTQKSALSSSHSFLKKKGFGTHQLSLRWKVSTETVRRYLKKSQAQKQANGMFLLDEIQLKKVENFLKKKSVKATITQQQKWKICTFAKKHFWLESIKSKENALFFRLIDTENKQEWHATYTCSSRERAGVLLERLTDEKIIVCNGVKNESTQRIVLRKIAKHEHLFNKKQ